MTPKGLQNDTNMDPKMEPDSYKHKRFLDILILFGVPTAVARARQDRRGPSLRPCPKSDPKWDAANPPFATGWNVKSFPFIFRERPSVNEFTFIFTLSFSSIRKWMSFISGFTFPVAHQESPFHFHSRNEYYSFTHCHFLAGEYFLRK